MDLLNMIITGYSFISQLLSDKSNIENIINEKKLEKSTAQINYETVESDLIRYAEAADAYIQKKHDIGGEVISNDERIQFISDFYRCNQDKIIYRFYIDPILNTYLDVLQARLSKALTSGEKYIVKQIDHLDYKMDQFQSGVNSKLDDLKLMGTSLQRLLERAGADQEQLKKYYDGFRRRFEETPDEEKQELIGNISLRDSFIDITADMGKSFVGCSAIEIIHHWFNSGHAGVKVLFGEPGHGKTTIGYKLIYDFITGATEYKGNVFFFPLVSPTYNVVSSGDILNICNAFRIDKFSGTSILDDQLIDGSLIILDGYDELQVALGNTSRFSNLVEFFNVLDEFATSHNAHILLTTRSTSVNRAAPGMKKKVNKSLIEMKPMQDEQQDSWILKHHPSYLKQFKIQRIKFANIKDMTGNILGIPFVFILMVSAEFDDDAGNLVELYDKLFESTFERKGKAEKEIHKEHLNYELLASRIFEQGDKRALVSSLEEGIRVNLFAFSYYLTIKTDEDREEQNGYYEFYHRTFYEYFLAWKLYRAFEKMEDPDAFLYFLSNGTVSDYVQKYLAQIRSNSKKTNEDYKNQTAILIKYIEKTDAVILRGGESNSIDKCMRIFLNAINFIRIFVDHLIVHDRPTNTYSEYEDTVLCKLFRTYRCQGINLSEAIMVGGHYDHADFRKGNLRNTNMSGKTDISFASLMNIDFSEANMENIDMYRADCDSAVFQSTNLRGARLEEASFKKSKFLKTDLRSANFKRANLTKAILIDVLIDENTSFAGTEVTGLQTNVDLSIAKGMENFEEMVSEGIILKRNPEC